LETLIAGYGKSGKAVCEFLENRQESYQVFDEGYQQDEPHVLSKCEDVHWSNIGRIIVSPGIPYDHPLIVMAMTQKIEVISEIEFAFLHCRGPVVAVTGSNGKSSTVTMLESIFIEAGRAVQLCGNIGKPFTQAVMENPEAVFVVEISSFQLETISTFNSQVAILLNVTPDHMDRHGSFEAYEHAKLRIFENQSSNDLGLIPPGYKARIPGSGAIVEVPGHGVQVSESGLIFDEDQKIEVSNPILNVPHQRLNALFAGRAAIEMGISIQDIEAGLNKFPGLKHRMECVGVLEGRIWINDSKATNTDAAQVALFAMTGPYILILGGKNKDADFSVLDFSKQSPEQLILYGKAADEIGEALFSIGFIKKPLFRDAILHAWACSKPGDVILLSPGCASFDQFGNFELRGEAFREIYNELARSVKEKKNEC